MDFPKHDIVSITTVLAVVAQAKQKSQDNVIFSQEELEKFLESQGIKAYDFLWSTLRYFKDGELCWLDLAALQNELEPFGQPIIKGFRRKVETHGLDLLIPHYELHAKNRV